MAMSFFIDQLGRIVLEVIDRYSFFFTFLGVWKGRPSHGRMVFCGRRDKPKLGFSEQIRSTREVFRLVFDSRFSHADSVS
jgi:hypothetical protein